MNYEIFSVDPKWQDYSLERWFDAVNPPGKGISDMELVDIIDELFALLPGGERFITSAGFSVVPVVIEKGGVIFEHKHPEHTLIYYVDVGDPPCAIIVAGERVIPEAGTAIYLPPGTPHAVELSKSETPRLSLAIRRHPE